MRRYHGCSRSGCSSKSMHASNASNASNALLGLHELDVCAQARSWSFGRVEGRVEGVMMGANWRSASTTQAPSAAGVWDLRKNRNARGGEELARGL